VNAPDKRGQPLAIVDIPRLIGTDYFDTAAQGMQEASDDLDDVEVINTGPSEASVAAQVDFIRSFFDQGVDGLLVAPGDRVGIDEVLAEALQRGIHVVTYDADATTSAREWFVAQAEPNAIAKALIDSLVAQQGEDASFGIVTGAFTTPNHARWIAEMEAYAEACYPDLTWLETLEGGDSATISYDQSRALLDTYADGILAIISLSSVGTQAAADAVMQADACGDVSVVGVATPNAIRPFVEAGCIRDAVMVTPADIGYAAVYVMRNLVDGELEPGDSSVSAGRLGDLAIVNGSEVILGEPFILTADNIDDFDS